MEINILSLYCRLNSNYTQAMNNLGNLYKNENNLTAAEKLLRQAVEIQ